MKERRTLLPCDPLREFAFVLDRWFVSTGTRMKEFAFEIRVTYDTVRHWRKARRWPSHRNFRAICRRTGIPPCRLICSRMNCAMRCNCRRTHRT